MNYQTKEYKILLIDLKLMISNLRASKLINSAVAPRLAIYSRSGLTINPTNLN